MNHATTPRVGLGEKRSTANEPHPGRGQHLRRALATAVVVPVTPYQADGNPDWVPTPR